MPLSIEELQEKHIPLSMLGTPRCYGRDETFTDEFRFSPPPAEIRREAQDAYEAYPTQYNNRVTYRTLTRPEIPLPTVEEECYMAELPTLHDKNFIQLVDEEIERRKNNAADGETIQPVSILDIGYGQGRALLEMRKRWGENVQLIGYGSTYHAEHATLDRYGDVIAGPTIDLLQQANVQLIDGNIIDIDKKLAEKFGSAFQVDFMLACHVLQYVRYPQWELLKKLYKLLRYDAQNYHGGILLACGKGMNIVDEKRFSIMPQLRKLGYDITFEKKLVGGDLVRQSLAIERTHHYLPADIRTIPVYGHFGTFVTGRSLQE